MATAMATVAAFFLSNGLAVSAPDLAWLVIFGAVNLIFLLAVDVPLGITMSIAIGLMIVVVALIQRRARRMLQRLNGQVAVEGRTPEAVARAHLGT